MGVHHSLTYMLFVHTDICSQASEHGMLVAKEALAHAQAEAEAAGTLIAARAAEAETAMAALSEVRAGHGSWWHGHLRGRVAKEQRTQDGVVFVPDSGEVS
jgi:hypothetical protein